MPDFNQKPIMSLSLSERFRKGGFFVAQLNFSYQIFFLSRHVLSPRGCWCPSNLCGSSPWMSNSLFIWIVDHKDTMVKIYTGMLLAHLLILMKNPMWIFLWPCINQWVEAKFCSTFMRNTQMDFHTAPTLTIPPNFFRLPPNLETLYSSLSLR